MQEHVVHIALCLRLLTNYEAEAASWIEALDDASELADDLRIIWSMPLLTTTSHTTHASAHAAHAP
eukprot:CAMPEP_0180482694 /NCGR_PEP_ID=MMETSP1036_2-20121128/35035_1 /TAXON_ID=632150 /ORGANISM="Azadinium spinosum, Strain 3D9" /LENGTH=65 /DNA_ID=CAMNT_0022490471 /DNA_START=158 /DNA_END=352 /DNA_ORIENTATION=-